MSRGIIFRLAHRVLSLFPFSTRTEAVM